MAHLHPNIFVLRFDLRQYAAWLDLLTRRIPNLLTVSERFVGFVGDRSRKDRIAPRRHSKGQAWHSTGIIASADAVVSFRDIGS